MPQYNIFQTKFEINLVMPAAFEKAGLGFTYAE